MTRTLAKPPQSPPSRVPGTCSFCQWISLEFPAQTDSSGKLYSVSKLVLAAAAALVIYKYVPVIRNLFSRPALTRSGDPAHDGTCSILDTKITSAEGCSILDTKITAGVELTDQNDSAEDSISELV